MAAGSVGMSKPNTTMAVAAVAIAFVAFAAAFYLLGGADVIADWLSPKPAESPSGQPAVTPAVEDTGGLEPDTQEVTTKGAKALVLPTGMSEAQALRLWQEQVDSQRNILKLVNGDISEFVIDDVTAGATTAELDVTAVFEDGTSAPGVIALHKLGENWFLAYVSGLRESETGGDADSVNDEGGEPATALPTAEEVDVGVLQTMLDEQAKSQEVFDDYMAGSVDRIAIDGIKEGPRTRTVRATMDEQGQEYRTQIVLVSREYRGTTMWFFTKFKKTGSGD